MSRTRKDRPYWVRSNDSKERREAVHNHLRHRREYVRTDVTTIPPKYVWDWDEMRYYKIPERQESVHVWDRWTEEVPCNIDEPMTHTHNRWRDGCKYYATDIGYGWPRHGAKKAVSQARRHNVKQQLKQAINYMGHHVDTDPNSAIEVPNGYDDWGTIWRWAEVDNWWDVDIEENPLYAKAMWWD
jgi:hypothetical protein